VRDNAINAADLRGREAKYFSPAGWTRFLKTYPTGKSGARSHSGNFIDIMLVTPDASADGHRCMPYGSKLGATAPERHVRSTLRSRHR
jgi:hypothetical protein